MATAVQSFRLCARACRPSSASRRIAQRIATNRRLISSSQAWRSDKTDAFQGGEVAADTPEKAAPSSFKKGRRSDKVVLALQEGMNEAEKEQYRALLDRADRSNVFRPGRKATEAELQERAERVEEHFHTEKMPAEQERAFIDMEDELKELDEVVSETIRTVRVHKNSFWGEDEEDQDLLTEDIDDDDFAEDDIMDMAHGKLEEHREYREYARIAAWQMPLLSKLARPFEPPTAEECLRFRYTTYMGENHPAQSKVVVEFSPRDMPLNEAQQLKLRKLLGPRWNPETDVAKMSCEQFDHQAQNKRYLGDLVNKLVAQAKDTTDMFEDVPLDTRHHQIKVKPRFPKEWRLTEERMRQIEDTRQKSLLLDQRKEEAGSLVDGAQLVEKHFKAQELLTVPSSERFKASNMFPSKVAPRQKRF